MRVIAGSARRLLLKTPYGIDTRPTTDRIKETLFNILNPDIPNCAFLDLYAGSGEIGIEALSRGASEAVFVENNSRAVRCIRENVEHTRMTERSTIMQRDVLSALTALSGNKRFDLIFMDPPYRDNREEAVLSAIYSGGLLNDRGYVIIEAEKDRVLQNEQLQGWEIMREKVYKTNKHIFLRLMEH